jgi:hypothetical protein
MLMGAGFSSGMLGRLSVPAPSRAVSSIVVQDPALWSSYTKFSVINCLLTPRSSEPSSTASFLCTAFFNVHSAITSKQHQYSTSTINMFVALKCAKAVGTTFGTFCVADILSNFILHPSQKVSTCSYCRCSGMKNPLEQTNQGTIRH